MNRLNGMRFEAVGKLTEAAEIYKAILEEDETNVVRTGRLKYRSMDEPLR